MRGSSGIGRQGGALNASVRYRRAGKLAWAALLIVLFATPGVAESPAQSGPVCRFAGLTLSADFAGGRLSGCTRTGPRHYTLRIDPEAWPINPSPWYAFRIQSGRSQRLVLTISYGAGRHRYAPKLRRNSGEWRRFSGAVSLSADAARATFSLAMPRGVLEVAAQPLLTLDDTAKWTDRLAAVSGVERGLLGHSGEGRPVPLLRSRGTPRPTVVVIGRQHPPELAGAFALRAFTERLLANDPLAEQFRLRFGLAVVPMLNPDGVARGHWRFDSTGTDLNRDWGPFARPETALVRDMMGRLKDEGRTPVLALDFHATHRDMLFTPPDGAGIRYAWFPGAWHAAISSRLPGPRLVRDSTEDAGMPTFKTWVFRTYRIPAVTVELGDETPPARIRAIGRIAAEEMMRLLLDGAALRDGGG